MEDIRVGEHVRTNRGNIDKVIIDYNGRCNNSNCNRKHISCKYDYYNEEDITKHSFNLVDLLENGDVVTFKIGSMEAIRVGIVHKFNDARSGEKVTLIDGYKLEDVDIKEVLTHEQFEANCYTVKSSTIN